MSTESSLLVSLLCIIGLVVTPAYVVLSGFGLLSAVSPFLKELASHGKTRTSVSADTETRKSASNKGGWYQHFVHGDAFLIHKKLFLLFYVVGLVALFGMAFHEKGFSGIQY